MVRARIEALDAQAKYWEEEIEGGVSLERKSLLEGFKELAETKADVLRLDLGGQAKYDSTTETVNITIRESEWTKLEKFKKWARESSLFRE